MLSERKSDLICYLDEYGNFKSNYVNLIKYEGSFVEFQQGKYTLILPASRVLKIKQGVGEYEQRR